MHFHPKKGDALIRAAHLVHGGSKRALAGVTCHKLVMHFAPPNVDPEYLETTPSAASSSTRPAASSYPLREPQS